MQQTFQNRRTVACTCAQAATIMGMTSAQPAALSRSASPIKSATPDLFDAIIIGAGAAGLFCAAQAAQAGLRILLLDHSRRLAEKIRISGGGRSNFTNRLLDPLAPQQHYISQNPHFCRSALSRYTPQDFISLVKQHGIAFHEKHKGQLFCDHSSGDLIRMLDQLCQSAGVLRWQPCEVLGVEALCPDSGTARARYAVQSDRGQVQARSLVIATGGLSIPKIGATGFGYRVAQQFGMALVEQRPGLVPLTFDTAQWASYKELAGIALPVRIATEAGASRVKAAGKAAGKGADKRKNKSTQTAQFDEDLLFTHRGLSGPAILQISNYWREGQPLHINLLPALELEAALTEAKQASRKLLANILTQWLPQRLVQTWVAANPLWQRPIDQTPDKALRQLAQSLHDWQITPVGTEGYAKAEVTLGGVDTNAISSQTMESKSQPGLYFIGEVLDVTGWLGGYNFQWAWASAHACALALCAQHDKPARA